MTLTSALLCCSRGAAGAGDGAGEGARGGRAADGGEQQAVHARDAADVTAPGEESSAGAAGDGEDAQ